MRFTRNLRNIADGLNSRSASPVSLEQFERHLYEVWSGQRVPEKLGIAVSGGCDSMALAALCGRLQQRQEVNKELPDQRKLKFHAFVVDHAARPESYEEAISVKNSISSRTGIKADVLTLKWPTSQSPLVRSNFESLARTLRYQALAKACFDLRIRALLLGHHLGDLSETMLLRMFGGYLGQGLHGIQGRAPIPECSGMVATGVGRARRISLVPSSGVDFASQTVLVESGGIQICRPLLEFTKAQLRATCVQQGMKWIEDKTNQDKTLTARNTIRSLLEGERLPQALRTQSLTNLARSWRERLAEHEENVTRMFNECQIRLDLSSGTVKARIPKTIVDEIQHGGALPSDNLEERRTRGAMLLRRIIMLASPSDSIRLQDLREPMKIAFPFLIKGGQRLDSPPSKVAPIAKTLFTRLSGQQFDPESQDTFYEFKVSRTPPTNNDDSSVTVVLLPPIQTRMETMQIKWTPQRLFDGRYWIRIYYRKFNRTPNEELKVRFLNEGDMSALRADREQYVNRKKLEEVLKKKAPGSVRYTLPAIVTVHEKRQADGTMKGVERLVALPTLNWSSAGWRAFDGRDLYDEGWRWDIRYKKADYFGVVRNHEFVA